MQLSDAVTLGRCGF